MSDMSDVSYVSYESNKKTYRTIHLLVFGRVTNVGFRNFVYHHALKLNIKGWVRNTKDNKVETVLSGRPKSLEDMLRLLQKGPAGSRVEKLEKKSLLNQEFSSFEVLY